MATIKSLKMLWGRAAGRCSRADCRLDLYEDETETDDPTLVGENCHIVAEEDKGPRGDPTMPVERRNTYANLILMCRNHHKVIDAQEGTYTVDVLHQMKNDHEKWVREQLGLDAEKQRDDERYAGLIDTWAQLADLDSWHAWSSHVLSHGQPSMSAERDAALQELRSWLLNRVWPGRYPDLDAAFLNFFQVLKDFHGLFREHGMPRGKEELTTKRFYKIDDWDEDRYHRLVAQYEFHVDLVQDLMLETTRAANLVCQKVREHILPSYRLKEGWLVVQSGPTSDLSFVDFVVRYGTQDQKLESPYPGLPAFLDVRSNRDHQFGSGGPPE